ncbi:MAG: preprotein translocase subunit YajC [Gemmatimonadetes bacterium]|nr:preprotein translocase subunit YajC [Gemmatimonadota bacterium]
MATIFLLQGFGGFNAGSLSSLILPISFLLIMYFLLIVPQGRERKRHKELVESLRPGDRVATLGGLVGEIISVKEDVVTLKTGDVRVLVERSKVTRRTDDPRPAAK